MLLWMTADNNDPRMENRPWQPPWPEWRAEGGIVHYEYMALAKKTSVVREAMLFIFEPRRFGASKYVLQ